MDYLNTGNYKLFYKNIIKINKMFIDHKKYTLLLISLLLCLSLSQNCIGPLSNDLIQTGIFIN